MTVLIVEDDENKALQLRDFVLLKVKGAELREARSYQSGLRAAIRSRPDLILLDMSMPTYDLSPSEPGGRPRAFAGRDILLELKRKKLPIKVIIVTQFERFGEGDETTTLDELKESLKRESIPNYVGSVYYHPARSDWREELTRLITEAIGRGN